MTLNCAIIDDEPLAVELLTSYVNRTPFLNLTGGYNSAISAIKALRETPVDVLFLDIQMPELSGLEFAKLLPKETRIVFTTAFSEYALEGYENDALGYLLKPISYESFIKVAQKALDWFNRITKIDNYQQNRFMFVKSDYKLVKISFDDILYIEGLKDYVRIYLENGEKIMSLMNMKTLGITCLVQSSYVPIGRLLYTRQKCVSSTACASYLAIHIYLYPIATRTISTRFSNVSR